MQAHLTRASHNQEFLECLDSKFPDLYFDWKITTTFYIAIHLLKALSKKRNVSIGETHIEIASSLDPKRCAKQVTPFPERMWKHYNALYRYSRTSRYTGFLDYEIEIEARKDDYRECLIHLEALKAYFKSHSIAIEKAA